ncbi:hypothetical protein HPP92_002963 [Vanilla planifolia]|uniref:Uncharacterized protein n=1 Tax=Vanilla planifolia TaxID=51239 RepID=A0A835SAU1_VANPL|nr:hypothetical protein HPP92_002963 [Vanilla planifolia]
MANCVFSAVGDGCFIETLVDEESQERSDSIGKDFRACNVGSRKCYDWRSTAIILGFEFFESLCLYGISTNLVIYLTKVIHESNTAAAAIVANWTGTNFLTPLLVALLADSYLGNYNTILFSSIIYIIGTLIVTFSATIQGSKPFIYKRYSPTTGSQKQTLFVGLYLIALGSGGVKSSLLPLGADQFDDNNPTQQEKKASFFSWFYFCINLGALVSSTLTVWIKENVSWSVGYGIASVCMALATSSFLLGTPTFRPGNLKNDAREEDINCLHEVEGSYSLVATEDEFRFLDKGANLSSLAAEGTNFASTWRLRRLAPFAQLKSLVGLFPIWLTNILYSMAYAQIYTTFIEQGRVMDKKIGSLTIPPASLVAFQVLSSMSCVLLCDKILLVTVRRFLGNGHGLTHLQRMGWALLDDLSYGHCSNPRVKEAGKCC